MFGWLKKKDAEPIDFPDNRAAFVYACETLENRLLVEAVIPALVLEQGSRGSEGERYFLVQLAGRDGGRQLWACTLKEATSFPAPGDLVGFRVVRYDPDMGMDARLSCTSSGHAWLMTLSDERALALVARQHERHSGSDKRRDPRSRTRSECPREEQEARPARLRLVTDHGFPVRWRLAYLETLGERLDLVVQEGPDADGEALRVLGHRVAPSEHHPGREGRNELVALGHDAEVRSDSEGAGVAARRPAKPVVVAFQDHPGKLPLPDLGYDPPSAIDGGLGHHVIKRVREADAHADRLQSGAALSAADVMAHCKKIASYKRPVHVEVWPAERAFPLTRTMKVDKLALQDEAQSIELPAPLAEKVTRF